MIRALPLLILLSACANTSVCNRADRLDCGVSTAPGERHDMAAVPDRYNGVVDIPDLTTPGRDDFSGDCVGCQEFDFTDGLS